MLDHRLYIDKQIGEVAKDLDYLIMHVDQKHRMQRKVQFFCDIRGYFIVNQVKGNYVEFGIYRGEMTYCAWKVLDKTNCFNKYVGLDVFADELVLDARERSANPFTQDSGYIANYEETKRFLEAYIGNKCQVIVGDFREKKVMDQVVDKDNKIALAVIDCNLLTSIEACVSFIFTQMQPGGIIFVDDYFINMGQGECPVDDILMKAAESAGWNLKKYKTYAPFASAFIALKKS